MRRIVYLVTVALLGAIVVLLAKHGSKVAEPTLTFHGRTSALAPGIFPLRLNPASRDELVLRLPALGTVEQLAVDLDVSGDVEVYRGETRSGGVDFVSTKSPDVCQVWNPAGFMRCSVAVNQRDVPLSIIIVPEPGTVVSIASLGIRHLRTTSVLAGRSRLLPVLLLIALSVLLVWILHRSVAASQWVLILTGVGVLAILQPLICGTIMAFLAALYVVGRRMRARNEDRADLLFGSIVGIVLALIAFKYERPAVADLAGLLRASPGIALGFSYVAIRLVDTLLRWYRGELRDITFREYLCFVLFPSTIAAGPIETLEDFPNKRLGMIGREDIAYGLGRMAVGLAKKLVLADYLFSTLLFNSQAGLFNRLALAPGSSSFPLVAGTLTASFLFAYFDFSAYADIAIGLGRLYGYRIREDFDWPVLAADLQDFWRRWHMSMTAWCLRNLYFPLVLRTRNRLVSLFSALIVMALWHAAALTWIAWAIHHTAGLAVNGVLRQRARRPVQRAWVKWLRPVGVLATLTFVIAGHSFILFSDFPTALRVYAGFWRGMVAWLV